MRRRNNKLTEEEQRDQERVRRQIRAFMGLPEEKPDAPPSTKKPDSN